MSPGLATRRRGGGRGFGSWSRGAPHLWARRGAGGDGDDELAAGVSVQQVADGRRRLGERVGPVDGGGELAGLDEVAQGAEVGGVLRRDEGAQLLADERGQQLGPDLAAAAAEQPSVGLAADDDQPSPRGEGTPETGQL